MSKEYDLNKIEENFRYLVIDSYRAIFNIHGRSYDDEPKIIQSKVMDITFESPLKDKVETRTRRQEEAPDQTPIKRNEQKATVERLPEVQIEDVNEPKRKVILSKDGKTARPGEYIYNTEDKEYVKWDPDYIFNEEDDFGNPIPYFDYIIESPPSTK